MRVLIDDGNMLLYYIYDDVFIKVFIFRIFGSMLCGFIKKVEVGEILDLEGKVIVFFYFVGEMFCY